MKPYSSSTLKLFSQHCPAALGFQEDGEIWNSAWNMAPGVAAHAIAQAVGEWANDNGRPPDEKQIPSIARATCDKLIAHGREFRGRHEPPMSPDDAYAGRDIAVPWLLANPVSPAARYEVELWLRSGEYSAIFDVHEVREDGDEEQSYSVAESWDYKTAWPTTEAELDTFQLRGHAVLLWENYPDVDVIRVGAINLRTWGRWSRDLVPSDEADRELIETWRADCVSAVRAANEAREARPGFGCIGCPYAYRCADAWAHSHTSEIADAYMMADTLRAHYAPLARELAKHEGVQAVNGGELGYFTKPGREVAADAHRAIAHTVFTPTSEAEFDAENARWLGLLQALSLGVTQIDKFAKWVYPGKENKPARDDLLDRLTEPTTTATFGVRRASTEGE